MKILGLREEGTDPGISLNLIIFSHIKCTVGTESIQTPLNFSLFVILQPFAKII